MYKNSNAHEKMQVQIYTIVFGFEMNTYYLNCTEYTESDEILKWSVTNVFSQNIFQCQIRNRNLVYNHKEQLNIKNICLKYRFV